MKISKQLLNIKTIFEKQNNIFMKTEKLGKKGLNVSSS